MSTAKQITLITAPSSLGLRPNEKGLEPTTWQAPDLYLKSGLSQKLQAKVVKLEHPTYTFDPQFGTKIRNGLVIRAFSLQLAAKVEEALHTGTIPIVLGGDCSILLGCLLGAKRAGSKGLVHVDGHCDYFHPGNYDVTTRLGTVAGMDLALATGKGELLLTQWDKTDRSLVSEQDAFHIGERSLEKTESEIEWGDITSSEITVITLQKLLEDGLETTATNICKALHKRNLSQVWLHVDFDILDQCYLPAVDSPGSPGLNFGELESFLLTLLRSGYFVGMDFTIYDPGLDPERTYVSALMQIIEKCSLQISHNQTIKTQ
ncbi:arginase family protein [Cytophagaceae bacterium YF14B1]|uniref:Arginase family protein n=1 Tax=Xanthocytophaga flava TaxID=3048013 RepID=A0AAE3QT53_9BACT|nr:arginase family protein [Xanthocytophaga flavus]MDJ1482770.1 arginase family protein [Xanthocytophaga flavus]